MILDFFSDMYPYYYNTDLRNRTMEKNLKHLSVEGVHVKKSRNAECWGSPFKNSVTLSVQGVHVPEGPAV